MAQEIVDGKVTGSSGVAKAGLTLGIIGTALGAGFANGNGGGLFNVFGNNCSRNTMMDMTAQISKLESERYTDYVGLDLYKNIVAFSNAEDAKIKDVQAQLSAFMIDIDKRVALNQQATELNRQYDALARDAGFKLLEQKLDCCCEKAGMKMDWLAEKECMNNASLLSYVNSNFIPGTLKLPASSICPTVQLA
jgi:hypothetical protein